MLFLLLIISITLSFKIPSQCFPKKSQVSALSKYVPKSVNQTKLDACIKIFRYRVKQDTDYYKTLIYGIYLRGNHSSENLYTSAMFLTIALNTCFTHIDEYDSKQIDNAEYVNSMTPNNINLLNFEMLELMLNNTNALSAEMKKATDLSDSLERGDLSLGKLFEDVEKELSVFMDDDNEAEYEEDEEESESEQDENSNFKEFDLNKLKNLEVFGYNYLDLSHKMQNIIGIVLIILIFGIVIIGLRIIANMNPSKEKTKKKKKKKQN